jgi:uncharacterized protein (UPF0276 family)
MTRVVQGVGLGLRHEFAEALVDRFCRIDWLEITPENWMQFGGRRRRVLDACAERWPIVPHSVSLSVGGGDPLDDVFLDSLSTLCRQVGAPYASDHLCYSTLGGAYTHDLLPLPFTEEALEHTVRRMVAATQRLELPLILENVSTYAVMPGASMDEVSFLCGVLEATSCGLLLDVNNVFVNSQNHGFDPYAFLDRIPYDRVVQIHIAGHARREDVLIDNHVGPVPDAVLALYRHALSRAGRMVPTLLEWDTDIPPLDRLLDELDRIRLQAREVIAP